MELTDFRLYQDVETLKEIVSVLYEQVVELQRKIEQLERQEKEDA